jgi:hypothetical protein
VKKKAFLIPSLLAAGFLPSKSEAVPVAPKTEDPKNKATLFDTFQVTQNYTLAGHRSHASHQSHRSSSGGSGIYVPPSNSTAPEQIMPAVPKTQKVLPGNSARFTRIISELQICLLSFGYYQGPITGVMDVETATAITKMQTAWGISVTGTVTPEVLSKCGIAVE